jgi:hypothetical protein
MDTPTRFFEHIVKLANKGVVSALDFTIFIGCENWLLMDAEDIKDCVDDAICAFKVRAVDTRWNMVAIIVKIDDLVPDGNLMWMNADELAIRMEAS